MLDKPYIFHRLINLSCAKDAHYFSNINSKNAILNCQHSILKTITANNRYCPFGLKHSFSKIRSVKDFKAAVPLTTYEQMHGLIIDQVKSGSSYFTQQLPLRYHPTSGSSSSCKLIPYTKSLANEYQRALHIWLHDLYKNFKGINHGRHFWSISPRSNSSILTSDSNTNLVGFDDDSEYLGWKSAILRKTQLDCSEITKLHSIENFKYALILLMLQSQNMSLVSVWSPTYFIQLLDILVTHKDQIVSDLQNNTITFPHSNAENVSLKTVRCNPALLSILQNWTAPSLETIHEISSLIWPSLSLISCWCDGPSFQSANLLKSLFPHCEMQPKGICATEGIITIPLEKYGGSIPALTSHFFEFQPIDSTDTVLVHELEKGKFYSVIMTTGGGLYRYKIGDIISVYDFVNDLPLIKFAGRDSISDIAGEKLHEYEIASALKSICTSLSISPLFYLLSPELNPVRSHYTLFVEFKSSNDEVTLCRSIETLLEEMLCKNYHYNYARQLNQLAHVEVIQITDGADIFYKRSVDEGRKNGDIKHVALDNRPDWKQWFQGKMYIKSGIKN